MVAMYCKAYADAMPGHRSPVHGSPYLGRIGPGIWFRKVANVVSYSFAGIV
jgi:hypothetical protein